MSVAFCHVVVHAALAVYALVYAQHYQCMHNSAGMYAHSNVQVQHARAVYVQH